MNKFAHILSFTILFSSGLVRIDAQADPLMWAKSAGGTSGDTGNSIAIDADDNIILTGQFYASATFGAGEANETSLTSTGGWDLFIAKYAPDGSVVWAKKAGGTLDDDGSAVTVDGYNNILVTGTFNGTATFGPGEANETSLVSAGESDIFIARYDPNGELLWARKAGGTSSDIGFGISVDGAACSVITGYFAQSAIFGAGEPNETSLSSSGAFDVEIYIAKYAPDGELVWAKKAGGERAECGNDIAVDSYGSILLTGYFYESATFGTGEANETVLQGTQSDNIFITKYNPDGTFAWAKNASGTTFLDNHRGVSVITDTDGNCLITGYIQGSATFGAGESNETTLSSTAANVFIAKYSSDGSFLWAKKGNGSSGNSGYEIAVDDIGNCVVTGSFQGNVTFGAGESSETMLTANGDFSDIFIAQFSPAGHFIWAQKAGGIYGDYGHGLGIDENGNIVITGKFRDTAIFGAGETAETTLTSTGSDDIFIAKYGLGDPIAVSLSTLQAIRERDGIHISWSTGCESNLAGFNIYRSNRGDGHYDKINAVMMPAHGKMTGDGYSYIDNQKDSSPFYYKLETIGLNGEQSFFGPVPVSHITNVSTVRVPADYNLYQNFPNPFNSCTTIRIDVPYASTVRIAIYDMHGRGVKTLVNQKLAGGTYTFNWDGTSDAGAEQTSGLYFCLMEAKDFNTIRKLSLIK